MLACIIDNAGNTRRDIWRYASLWQILNNVPPPSGGMSQGSLGPKKKPVTLMESSLANRLAIV